VAPLKALFDLLQGPNATAMSTGTRWRNLLVCAINDTMLSVPNAPGNAQRWASMQLIGPFTPLRAQHHEPSARDTRQRVVAFFQEHLDD
jgi:hypothetical protein